MGRSAKVVLIAVILSVLVFAASGIYYYYHQVYLYKTDYYEEVSAASASSGVDIYLIFAVIKVESAFNSSAVSEKGAVGLMQLMPETAVYITGDPDAESRLSEPGYNIAAGAAYLKYLFDKFDSSEWVLAAYNAGESRAAKWHSENIDISAIPYLETRNYVSKVTKAIKRYKELYYLY